MCVIYGSQTGGGKKWEEGEKSCWWLPDWEVEGVVAAEKDLLVVARLGSLAEVMEKRCG